MGNHRLRAAHLTRVLAAVLARLIDVNEKVSAAVLWEPLRLRGN
jgi:hypothetical protein